MKLINTNETMDDLISKQVVLDEINKMPTVIDTNGARYIEKTCLGIRINVLLPVDAVPVIRCGKCNFWDRNHISCEGLAKCLTGESGVRYRNRNDFCSRGKRKDGDSNA